MHRIMIRLICNILLENGKHSFLHHSTNTIKMAISPNRNVRLRDISWHNQEIISRRVLRLIERRMSRKTSVVPYLWWSIAFQSPSYGLRKMYHQLPLFSKTYNISHLLGRAIIYKVLVVYDNI